MVQSAEPPRVAFLFTGQGAQYPDMGKRLYETEPRFQDAIDRCAAILDTVLEPGLLDVLYPTAKHGDAIIHQTKHAQPALFAIEFALTELWESWGVHPEWVMGHSLGEFVAAHRAGVMDLESSLQLVVERGRLMQQAPGPGLMAAVMTDIDRLNSHLEEVSSQVSLAAINGPQQLVVSGEAEGAAS